RRRGSPCRRRRWEAREGSSWARDVQGVCKKKHMAFQLKQDESVRKGLRRLARKALKAACEAAASQQPPDDDAIHTARTSLKKACALCGLIDADDGVRSGGARKRLRSVNRELSALRDTDAMLETLEQLEKKDPHILSEHSLARLKRSLEVRKAAALKVESDE